MATRELSNTTPPAFYGGGGTSGYTKENPKPGSPESPEYKEALRQQIIYQQQVAAEAKAGGSEISAKHEAQIRLAVALNRAREARIQQQQAEQFSILNSGQTQQQSVLDMGSLESTYQKNNQQQGGYFVNQQGQPISSMQDLTKKGFIRTATPSDITSGQTFKQGNVVYGQQGVKEYNSYVEKQQPSNLNQNDIIPSDITEQGFNLANTYGSTEKESLFNQLISTGIIGFPGSTLIFNKEKTQRVANELSSGGVKGFLLGGESFYGVGNYGQLPLITNKDVQNAMRGVPGKAGFPVRAASYLVPTTTLGVGFTAAAPGILKVSPPIVKGAVSTYAGITGTLGALDKSLTAEQRTASGIIGIAGTGGAIYEFMPFIKGGLAKLTPSYRSVETNNNIKIIKNVPSNIPEKSPLNIALIPEGKVLTKGNAAFQSGAYGFTKAEQTYYIGKIGDVTTSARDLFTTFNKKNIPITSKEMGLGFSGKKEMFGMFGTPWDIKTGFAQTRISRLGLKTFGDLFKFPGKNAELRFFNEKPQIVIFEKAKVTRTGKGGTFKYGGKKTTELEVTAIPGSIIKSGKKIGSTSIYGNKVNIFSAQLGKGKGSTLNNLYSGLGKIKGFDVSSAMGRTSVLNPGVLVSIFGYKGKSRSTPTTKSTLSSLPSIKSIYSPKISSQSSTPSTIKSIYSSSYGSPSTPRTSRPTTPPTTPRVTYKSIYPTTPRYTPRITRQPQKPYSIWTSTSTSKPRYNFYNKPLKLNLPKYSVQVRRFGKFRNVGVFGSYRSAFEYGRRKSESTLARSFMVKGLPQTAQLPKGFYRQRKNPEIIIESKYRALNMPGELKELFSFKRSKKKRKFSLF